MICDAKVAPPHARHALRAVVRDGAVRPLPRSDLARLRPAPLAVIGGVTVIAELFMPDVDSAHPPTVDTPLLLERVHLGSRHRFASVLRVSLGEFLKTHLSVRGQDRSMASLMREAAREYIAKSGPGVSVRVEEPK